MGAPQATHRRVEDSAVRPRWSRCLAAACCALLPYLAVAAAPSSLAATRSGALSGPRAAGIPAPVVEIQQVVIEGNKLIPGTQLQPLVAALLGRRARPAEIQAAAAGILGVYARHDIPGAYVSVQTPRAGDGTVTIVVVEPHPEAVAVRSEKHGASGAAVLVAGMDRPAVATTPLPAAAPATDGPRAPGASHKPMGQHVGDGGVGAVVTPRRQGSAVTLPARPADLRPVAGYWFGPAQLAHLQRLPRGFSLYTAVIGQASDGYAEGRARRASGELAGIAEIEQGAVAQVGVFHALPVPMLPGKFSAGGLVQGGKVWLNRNVYSGLAESQFRGVAGAGLEFGYHLGTLADFRLGYVQGLGGDGPTGGGDSHGQLWLSARFNL